MTQWNFKGNYLLCISFLLVADRFIYKLSKFAKSHFGVWGGVLSHMDSACNFSSQ